jgi:FMN-dependent NADH-azoreductase
VARAEALLDELNAPDVIGITDVEVIRVEGHAYGPEAAEKALFEALSKVAEVAIAA